MRRTANAPAAARRRRAAWTAALLALGCAALGACSSGDDDLNSFIAETEREGGGRVEPLPEVQPYQTYTYADSQMRSPFMPASSNGNSLSVRPDEKRNREFLEQYSLDTLKMVGTLQLGGVTYGLVQTRDGLVHRVLPGNYMGQNDGRITAITASKIEIREIVPDGLGGYIERPAALALSE
ncbi:MAG TPA: pilus assembly protein PilP [Steroidobacteraceae bacterium]|nr:pilus assembly protein PilP [Steroidobacteraceae bacterium]